jgi:hypothetical protein
VGHYKLPLSVLECLLDKLQCSLADVECYGRQLLWADLQFERFHVALDSPRVDNTVVGERLEQVELLRWQVEHRFERLEPVRAVCCLAEYIEHLMAGELEQ